MKLSHGFALVLLLLLGAACRTPYPGYRHEGEGPDGRLLELVERYHLLQDETRPRSHAEEQLLVDGGRALSELRKLHLDYPEHVPTMYALATFYHQSGQKELASGYIDTILYRQSIHPEAGILRSQIAIEDGNLPAARRVLEQQIRYTPDHPGLREAISGVLYLEARYDEAREELAMAVRLGAPEWRVAFNLGLIAEAEGNLPEAAQKYEIAMQENPEFRAAASRLAGLRAFSGETVR